MSCLLRAATCTASILTRTGLCVPKSSLFGPSRISWKRNSKYASAIAADLEFLLTRLSVQCYSTRSSSSGKSPRRSKKVDTDPVMEHDKEAFFVVRKGDVVGVYKSLSECQAQVGSSISDPPVSVYKGYSLPDDTEEYLASHGFKNAMYTIKASDLNEELFGPLVPCLFQEPASSKGESKDSKKRSLEVLESEVVNAETVPIDPSRKHVKLDCHEGAEAASSDSKSCILEFDGASKGNPGQAGAGAVLRAIDGSLICRLREGLGIVTNNVAEYRAMILGLKYALKKGYTSIRVQGDSKLVCMQIQGLWKVHNPNMSTLCAEAKLLKKQFQSFKISHVERALNSEADQQANLAITLADGQVKEV